jgi:hypothetical protein
MLTRLCAAAICLAVLLLPADRLPAQELTEEAVVNSIEMAKRFLISQQNNDGSWNSSLTDHQVGVTSLALLALVNTGMTPEDEPVAKALKFLRAVPQNKPDMTYEVSLMISALAAANDGRRDQARLFTLAQRLADAQITRGDNAGSWSYNVGRGFLNTPGDRSNGQFAILALRDAAHAGVPIDVQVWRRARKHWLDSQQGRGWGYTGNQSPTGSMTVAGIATLVITDSMLPDGDDLNPDGTPNCCGNQEPDDALEKGIQWMGEHFAVGHNPGSRTWLLYYLYGMERAGRLSGRRFFGQHDWYRAGAEFLVTRQSKRWGSWQGVGGHEKDPIIGTSFALLFLSKGLAPVLINKLEYRSEGEEENVAGAKTNWNKHRSDVRNLTEMISGMPKWPKLVTWQVADLDKITRFGSVSDLLQAPVLYISGEKTPAFSDEEIEMLKLYIEQGGFIFASNACQGAGFDTGMRELVKRIYPDGEGELKRLTADHPVFRSEYLLDADAVELLGVDFGCRTAIIYSPDDLGCLWNKWIRHDPPNRAQAIKTMILRATRIGVNVVAYATGREPPNRLKQHDIASQDGQQDSIERGFLQIAKLRHSGGWDAAPQALRNLLLALNRTVGMSASTKQRDLPASDANIFKYPMLYMHGRNRFQMTRKEQEQLRTYLNRGGVLFADSCCGAEPFDASFRELMQQVFSDKPLRRIPIDHEMFSSSVGHDIRTVRRRMPDADKPGEVLDTVVREGEPFLEGIEIDGRLAVIYSKYDISCALQRQASVACAGYVPEDAVRIAVNIVLYALLQDVRYQEPAK